jgi:hypothetical protein
VESPTSKVARRIEEMVQRGFRWREGNLGERKFERTEFGTRPFKGPLHKVFQFCSHNEEDIT